MGTLSMGEVYDGHIVVTINDSDVDEMTVSECSDSEALGDDGTFAESDYERDCFLVSNDEATQSHYSCDC